MPHRDGLHAGECRLCRGVGRAQQPVDPRTRCSLRHREDSADAPQPPVEPKLTDCRMPVQALGRKLPGRREDRERDRQVER